MIRVLIVDDHPVVRSGLRALLGGEPGLEVVGAAASGAEALELAASTNPDVVLCDLRLGEGLDPARHGEVGVHFYPFGGIGATADWIRVAS